MKDIVLFIPPVKLYREFFNYPLFSSLGVYLTSAFLKKNGIQNVRIVDTFYMDEELPYFPLEEQGFFRFGVLKERWVKKISAFDPEIIFIYSSMYSYVARWEDTFLDEVVQTLRGMFPRALIGFNDFFISGYSYYPYDSVKLLKERKEIDFCIQGEAEYSTLEFVKNAKDFDALKEIPGVSVKSGGEVFKNFGRPRIVKNLDELPYPDFESLNMKNFFEIQKQAIKKDLIHEYREPVKILPLMTSRGCPYSCYFCSNSLNPVMWRGHSVSYLKKEILYLKEKFHPDVFFFFDENISVNKKRFFELVKFLGEHEISWDAVNGIRADDLTEDVFVYMKKSKNKKVTTSGESGDDVILNKLLNKKLSLNNIERVALLSLKHKIPAQIHFIAGVPGETKASVNKTLLYAYRLLKEYRVYPLVMHAVLMPGTKMREDALKNGMISEKGSIPYQLEEKVYMISSKRLPQKFVNTALDSFNRSFQRELLKPAIQVSSSCNLNCLFCEHKNRKGHDLATIKEKILWFKKTGAKSLMISPPDPFVEAKKLIYTLSFAQKIGLKDFSIYTNAIPLANPLYVKVLNQFLIKDFEVMLPSPDPLLYDSFAKSNNAFKFARTGIENLKKHGFSITLKVPLINELNAKSLIDFVSFYKINKVILENRLDFTDKKNRSFLNSFFNELKEYENIHFSGVPLCLFSEFKEKIVPKRFDFAVFNRLNSSCLECEYLLNCDLMFEK